MVLSMSPPCCVVPFTLRKSCRASAHSTLYNDMCNYSLSFLFILWPFFTNTNVSIFRKKKNQGDMYILWDHSFNFFSGNGPCVASPSHLALPSYPLMCLLSLPNKGIKMGKIIYLYIFLNLLSLGLLGVYLSFSVSLGLSFCTGIHISAQL